MGKRRVLLAGVAVVVAGDRRSAGSPSPTGARIGCGPSWPGRTRCRRPISTPAVGRAVTLDVDDGRGVLLGPLRRHRHARTGVTSTSARRAPTAGSSCRCSSSSTPRRPTTRNDALEKGRLRGLRDRRPGGARGDRGEPGGLLRQPAQRPLPGRRGPRPARRLTAGGRLWASDRRDRAVLAGAGSIGRDDHPPTAGRAAVRSDTRWTLRRAGPRAARRQTCARRREHRRRPRVLRTDPPGRALGGAARRRRARAASGAAPRRRPARTRSARSLGDHLDHGFRPDIEGLRAIAVVAVVLYHGRLLGLHGGFVGVDVFFVVSGFLITRLILGELAAHRPPRRCGVLGPAGPPAAAGVGPRRRRHRDRRPRVPAAAHAAHGRRGRRRGGHVLVELPVRRAPRQLLRRPARRSRRRRRCCTSGRWPSRSSSTCAGRCCSCCSPAGRGSTGGSCWRRSSTLGGLGFVLAAWLTPRAPSWAFFLLPTRMGELLAGALLARARHAGRGDPGGACGPALGVGRARRHRRRLLPLRRGDAVAGHGRARARAGHDGRDRRPARERATWRRALGADGPARPARPAVGRHALLRAVPVALAGDRASPRRSAGPLRWHQAVVAIGISRRARRAVAAPRRGPGPPRPLARGRARGAASRSAAPSSSSCSPPGGAWRARSRRSTAASPRPTPQLQPVGRSGRRPGRRRAGSTPAPAAATPVSSIAVTVAASPPRTLAPLAAADGTGRRPRRARGVDAAGAGDGRRRRHRCRRTCARASTPPATRPCRTPRTASTSASTSG